MSNPRSLLDRAEDRAMRAEWSFSHPLNAQSEMRGHSLAEFPRHGKRFVRSGAKMTMWSTKGEEAFPGFERP